MMWWFMFLFLVWMTANVMAGLLLMYLTIESFHDPETANRWFTPQDRSQKRMDKSASGGAEGGAPRCSRTPVRACRFCGVMEVATDDRPGAHHPVSALGQVVIDN